MYDKIAADSRISFGMFFKAKSVFTLRNVIVMGLMVAFTVILSRFATIIIPPGQRVTFVYVPGVVVAALYGPWAALAFGFISDFVKYISNPGNASLGAYNPLYGISDMVHYFIYACFLYRRMNTGFVNIIIRAAIARLLVVAVVFFGLNYVWRSLEMGSVASGFFTGIRLILNLGLLPVHAFIIAYTCKLLGRVNKYTAN